MRLGIGGGTSDECGGAKRSRRGLQLFWDVGRWIWRENHIAFIKFQRTRVYQNIRDLQRSYLGYVPLGFAIRSSQNTQTVVNVSTLSSHCFK